MKGDPTVTSGTGRPMEVTNGTPGSYWNYSYKDWREKSAYKGKAKSNGKPDKPDKKAKNKGDKETA